MSLSITHDYYVTNWPFDTKLQQFVYLHHVRDRLCWRLSHFSAAKCINIFWINVGKSPFSQNFYAMRDSFWSLQFQLFSKRPNFGPDLYGHRHMQSSPGWTMRKFTITRTLHVWIIRLSLSLYIYIYISVVPGLGDIVAWKNILNYWPFISNVIKKA